MRVLAGIVTDDGVSLQYILPDNEDILLGCACGLMAEIARKMGKNEKEETKIWVKSICEQTEKLIEERMV